MAVSNITLPSRQAPDESTQGMPPAAVMHRLLYGYQVAQAIHVAATLGIADLLADGPRTSDDLAVATGSHPSALYRLLRGLASVGVFREDDSHLFALAPLGDCLRSDADGPVGPWARFIGRPWHWQSWGHLLHSVRTGETASRHAHGMGLFEYFAQHPEEGAAFDAAMTGISQRQAAAVLAVCDFGRFGRVVDVGGGQGAFLAAILARHPATQGVLFDLPHVIAHAQPVLRAAGVADRCRVVGGDFFEAVPDGGDAYVVKNTLFNWDDDRAMAILRTCRRAMGPAGTLLVLDPVLAGPNEGEQVKFMDINMLVVATGQVRTPEEYAALFARAGFRLVGVTATASEVSVVEGSPAVLPHGVADL
jgi:SAM-dependent methyltransferase